MHYSLKSSMNALQLLPMIILEAGEQGMEPSINNSTRAYKVYERGAFGWKLPD
jgi:hypothetical protein